MTNQIDVQPADVQVIEDTSPKRILVQRDASGRLKSADVITK